MTFLPFIHHLILLNYRFDTCVCVSEIIFIYNFMFYFGISSSNILTYFITLLSYSMILLFFNINLLYLYIKRTYKMIFSICLIKESFNRLNYFVINYFSIILQKDYKKMSIFSYSSVNTVIIAFYIKNITNN